MGLYLPTGGKPEPQQSQHWYTREGVPCYEQATQKGGLRPTDLRDARKQGLVPSVTTVLSVLAKPALETWKVRQGILAALTLTRQPGEPDDQFLARVMSDSGEQAKAAAEEGTRIHDACECSWKGQHYPHQYQPHVDAVREEVARLFPEVDDWIAEASFGHELGFGGKVDLHSPSTGIVVDYKSTDERAGSTKRFHYDQHYQLAAYQVGLRLPHSRCANIFVSRSAPGVVFSHVWSEDDIQQGKDTFLAALQVWKCVKKFDPSFQEEARAA